MYTSVYRLTLVVVVGIVLAVSFFWLGYHGRRPIPDDLSSQERVVIETMRQRGGRVYLVYWDQGGEPGWTLHTAQFRHEDYAGAILTGFDDTLHKTCQLHKSAPEHWVWSDGSPAPSATWHPFGR